MYFSDKHSNSLRLSFLICTLLTLAPTDKFFQKINLKRDILLGGEKYDYILTNFESFYACLNKVSVRRFAYILIRPILFEKEIYSQEMNVKKEFYSQALLLKKYLKKFKFLYKYYFFLDEGNINLNLTDKEINLFAISSLFLLVGI